MLSTFCDIFLVERDPRKRRVKPVQKHLIQVDFGLSDSEGDSDYQLEENSGGRNNASEKTRGWSIALTDDTSLYPVIPSFVMTLIVLPQHNIHPLFWAPTCMLEICICIGP